MYQSIIAFGMFMAFMCIVIIFGITISPFYSRRRKYFFIGLALSKIITGTMLFLLTHDMGNDSMTIFILSRSPQFFIGPFYFFLFGALFGYHETWTRTKLLHFIPAAVTCMVLIIFTVFAGQIPKDGIVTVLKILTLLQCFHILLYYLLTAYQLFGIKGTRIEIRIGIIMTAAYSITIISVLTGIFLIEKSYYINFLSVILAYDGFVFMAHYVISYRYPFFRPLPHPIKNKKLKKAGSKNLNSLDYGGIENRLNEVFAVEKIYRMEDLSLSMLAREIGIQPYQLSHYLNNRVGKNFNSLVNSYRVDEAKSLLAEEPQKSIISIAFETGFNSKSSFNRIFQNQTGMTPSDYRVKCIS